MSVTLEYGQDNSNYVFDENTDQYASFHLCLTPNQTDDQEDVDDQELLSDRILTDLSEEEEEQVPKISVALDGRKDKNLPEDLQPETLEPEDQDTETCFALDYNKDENRLEENDQAETVEGEDQVTEFCLALNGNKDENQLEKDHQAEVLDPENEVTEFCLALNDRKDENRLENDHQVQPETVEPNCQINEVEGSTSSGNESDVESNASISIEEPEELDPSEIKEEGSAEVSNDDDEIVKQERLKRLSGLFDFSPSTLTLPEATKRHSRASASPSVQVEAHLTLPAGHRDSITSHKSDYVSEEDDPCTTSFTFKAGTTNTPPPADHNFYFDGNLDRFERICTLGTGTFGRVFLTREKLTNQYYALKMMAIRELIDTKQVQHVHSEKQVLQSIHHEFVVKLNWTYKDTRFLYMMFDFAPGGELFAYLRNTGYFKRDTARFYAAETLLVLEYLHERKIVYRDLKPENLLLAADGHLVITDFGFAKRLGDRTWTLCGTPEYLAPEIIACKGHNLSVDYWALGVLMFEMMAGFPPFHGPGPIEIYDKILNHKPKFPRYFDLVAKDCCKKLLSKDRTKRLGSMKNGAQDIKNHKFFKTFDWEAAETRQLKPPIMPTIYYAGDVGNFDEYEEDEMWDKIRPCRDQYLDLFAKW